MKFVDDDDDDDGDGVVCSGVTAGMELVTAVANHGCKEPRF